MTKSLSFYPCLCYRATLLDVLDSLMGCGDDVVARVVLPCLDPLLGALKRVVVDLWTGQGPAQVRECTVYAMQKTRVNS